MKCIINITIIVATENDLTHVISPVILESAKLKPYAKTKITLPKKQNTLMILYFDAENIFAKYIAVAIVNDFKDNAVK